MTTEKMYMGDESDWRAVWPKPGSAETSRNYINRRNPFTITTNSDGTKTITKNPPSRDRQVGGDHYKKAPSNMQPWDIIDAWGLDFYAGSVLSYLLRHPSKGGKEDLQKARHYLDKMIEGYEDAS